MNKYIYESPDGGETVYRRLFGDYTKKQMIVPKEGKWIKNGI